MKAEIGKLTADLQTLFIKKKWSLALAESCTGGRLAAAVTSRPGSSAYFLGSLVTYANSAKQALLRVPASLLEEYGAVSEPVVQAMAEGACNALQSDWAIGVSGIAGPDGGSENKPVGLVFFSVVGPNIDWQSRQVFDGDRETVMHAAVEFALNALWRLANEDK